MFLNSSGCLLSVTSLQQQQQQQQQLRSSYRQQASVRRCMCVHRVNILARYRRGVYRACCGRHSFTTLVAFLTVSLNNSLALIRDIQSHDGYRRTGERCGSVSVCGSCQRRLRLRNANTSRHARKYAVVSGVYGAGTGIGCDERRVPSDIRSNLRTLEAVYRS
jgi:hypothetical protein